MEYIEKLFESENGISDLNPEPFVRDLATDLNYIIIATVL